MVLTRSMAQNHNTIKQASNTKPTNTHRADTPTAPQADNQTFTLIVSPDNAHLHLELAHMHHAGDLFRTATQPCYRESRERRLHLPSETPSLVETYLHFLRHGKLSHAAPSSGISKSRQTREMFGTLTELYVLGQRMLDAEFRHVVLEAFVAVVNSTGRQPLLEVITDIYDRTHQSSPLRRLMVDVFRHNQRASWDWGRVYEESHPEFIVDLLRVGSGGEDAGEVKRVWGVLSAEGYREGR